MTSKPFKILSIDGGGIRGVFPAKILALLEAKLKQEGREDWQIKDHFNLICGTSTGGILGISLSLGIPAQEIYNLYVQNASLIFGKKRSLLGTFFHSAHDRKVLENLIRDTFRKQNNGEDPRLKDCSIPLCIPVYDLNNGQSSVLKTRHHERYNRDYHIPAYQAALATSAAPTYFDPYSANYTLINSDETVPLSNRVDGGVVANNPSLVGIYEAIEAFNQPLNNLRLLSIGTGHRKYSEATYNKGWGYRYWMVQKGRKGQIIDLFMQGQSQVVENLISLMQNGIDKQRADKPSFHYKRINTDLNGLEIGLDETNSKKLKSLSDRASYEFNNNVNSILSDFIIQ